MKIPAFVITNDEKTKEILKLYLEEFELFSYTNTDNIYDEIKNAEKAALIIEISDDNEHAIDTIFEACKLNKNCKVLVMSETPSVDLIVKAMRAGAKEFLPLPLIKTEVYEIFNKLKESFEVTSSKNSKCKMISVYSNKGGIGKTAISTNLALELAKITKEKVALIDLNFQMGDVTTFLDMKPSFNISYMLENINKINEDFLLSTLEKYQNTNLYVLADPPYFKQAQNISAKQISKLLNILKETFSYIVIDCESGFDEKDIETLTESDFILLTTIANLPALRNTQRCLELFNKLGFDSNKVKILLNRYMENDEIGEEEIKTLLGKDIFWKFPNNYFTMMSAINKGIPVCDMNPDSNISKSYTNCVLKIIDRIYKDETNKKLENLLGGKYGT